MLSTEPCPPVNCAHELLHSLPSCFPAAATRLHHCQRGRKHHGHRTNYVEQLPASTQASPSPHSGLHRSLSPASYTSFLTNSGCRINVIVADYLSLRRRRFNYDDAIWWHQMRDQRLHKLPKNNTSNSHKHTHQTKHINQSTFGWSPPARC